MPERPVQKLIPSLHVAHGVLPTPVDILAMKLRSDALNSVTVLLPEFVTRMRSPSKLAVRGPDKIAGVLADGGHHVTAAGLDHGDRVTAVVGHPDVGAVERRELWEYADTLQSG